MSDKKTRIRWTIVMGIVFGVIVGRLLAYVIWKV